MTAKEIQDKVDSVLKEQFLQYDVEKAPDIENNPDFRLTHGNIGFAGEFTFLYVDMRGSSTYTDQYRLQTITKIYKAYHHCMVECITHFNGKVRSFDGDRVLAVFDGHRKADDAISCAMTMVGCKFEILKPKIKTYFRNDDFSLGVGIATGSVMVSKAGVGYDKNNRDLIWIGDAANLGAKLSDEANTPNSIYICETTFRKLHRENKSPIIDGKEINLWTKDKFDFKRSKLIFTKQFIIVNYKEKPAHNTRSYVHWLADVHSGSFAPAFTLSFHDSECSRKPPMHIA